MARGAGLAASRHVAAVCRVTSRLAASRRVRPRVTRLGVARRRTVTPLATYKNKYACESGLQRDRLILGFVLLFIVKYH